MVNEGPQQPVHMALLATVFLLREVEASTARSDACALDSEKQEITWRLPSSKSDHMALGVSRCLGCLCGVEGFCCPYHLALEHMSWLTQQQCHLEEGCPLIPYGFGTTCWQDGGR